jgi:hypothetical protein
MKALFFSSFIFLFFTVIDKCERENQDQNQNDVSLGETIDLTLKESVKIGSENLEIEFVSISDSRCPLGVNCIQAGKAMVAFKLTKDEKAETLNLESKGLCQAEDGSCGSEGKAHGYTVKLINVLPYPTEPKTDGTKAVFAKLIVSK